MLRAIGVLEYRTTRLCLGSTRRDERGAEIRKNAGCCGATRASSALILATTTILLLLSAFCAAADGEGRETISVRIETRTGGSLEGLVVDHNDHGLVIVSEHTPYVFAWRELTGATAYDVKRKLLILRKGNAEKLSGLDHFDLGEFALKLGRTDLAISEFRFAIKRKRSLQTRVDGAWEKYNTSKTRDRDLQPRITTAQKPHATPTSAQPRKGERPTDKITNLPPDAVRTKIYESYLAFGEKVRETLGKDIRLLETEHFLIWTDWRKRDHDELMVLCEAMYLSVCKQFDLDASESIFLSKCPVFCFQKKGRFRRFAQQFDGYGGKDSVGYTRSVEQTGHVHVVVVSQGDSPADKDRFASTLVHEGTHAVIHRLFSTRLIPHWVNEGYAELLAQRVLADRCVTGGNAKLIARQYVRYDWPIGELLASSGPIGVHQYAIAQSVVMYMEEVDRAGFSEFIRGLKSGDDLPTALSAAFDGQTLGELERRWRAWVSDNDKVAVESP